MADKINPTKIAESTIAKIIEWMLLGVGGFLTYHFWPVLKALPTSTILWMASTVIFVSLVVILVMYYPRRKKEVPPSQLVYTTPSPVKPSTALSLTETRWSDSTDALDLIPVPHSVGVQLQSSRWESKSSSPTIQADICPLPFLHKPLSTFSFKFRSLGMYRFAIKLMNRHGQNIHPEYGLWSHLDQVVFEFMPVNYAVSVSVHEHTKKTLLGLVPVADARIFTVNLQMKRNPEGRMFACFKLDDQEITPYLLEDNLRFKVGLIVWDEGHHHDVLFTDMHITASIH